MPWRNVGVMAILGDMPDLSDPARKRRLLEAALAAGDRTAGTRYRLWEICQACGDPAASLVHLRDAIAIDPLRLDPRAPLGRRRSILALAVPGDFQANLPLRFLFGDTAAIHTLWIADPRAVIADPRAAIPRDLPEIGAVFIAIAEDERHAPALAAADGLAAAIGHPVINDGAVIAAQSRDAVSARLDGIAGAVVPRQRAVARDRVRADAPCVPFIIRPVRSHAGRSLARIDDAPALEAYLASESASRFFVAPFVDYRGRDGLFRKCRIVFVEGRPYPVHLAIHDDWAIWYYNARMDAHPARLREEAAFLLDMEGVLGPRATRALYAIAARTKLDYFGLDAALMPDGRLLVFEIETGMIVHDPGPSSCVRARAFERIRHAVARMLDQRIGMPSARGLRPMRAAGRPSN